MPNEEVQEQYVPSPLASPTYFFVRPYIYPPPFFSFKSPPTLPSENVLITFYTHRFESSAKEAKPESDKYGVGGTA